MTPIEDLEKFGYCRLEGEFSKEEIDKTLELLRPYDKGLPIGEDYEKAPRLNRQARNIYCLYNKDIWFLRMLFKSQRAEEILKYFLNDKFYKQIPQYLPNYILRSFGARSTDKEPLPLHIDSFVPYPSDKEFITMQMAIVLEDSNIYTGCTIAIPGSHLSGEYAKQEDLKDAVPIEAKAGDILLWTGSLKHATLGNNTDKTRWAMIATFSRWWVKQHFDVVKTLPNDTYWALSDKEKAIMGFCSQPPLDENDYLDVKGGYERLYDNPW